nr:uncharacterized protein LOC129438575 [Misgurnus anguillicaudatus]
MAFSFSVSCVDQINRIHCSFMDQTQSTDGDFSSGCSLVYQKRSDPEPSCVSMKSEASMVQPLNINSGDNQPDLNSVIRRDDPEPSCVSMKSDASMVQPLYLNSGDKQPDLKSIHLSGAIITEPDKPESLPQDFSDKIDPGFSHESEVLNTFRSNIRKRCQCLFEGTPKQSNPTSLNEIYTELNITQSESGEISNEHEVRQIETQSRRTTTEETPIKCNEIFNPLPEQHKHIRSVLTKGVAGIGKTVSVQKFILDWAEEKENQDVHLIFPLPFREINLMKDKTLSLLDLLHRFFPETKEMEIFSDEYKVLFIFDGLDECRLSLDFHSSVRLCDVNESTSVDVMLTNLIKGNLFPSALIWITSRPAAADLIPSECVDRVTEIRGFSDPQKEEYFRKRIRHKSLAYEIISHLKASRSLYIMCHIPVFCWISVTVLERILSEAERREIPKTLTQMYTHFLIIQTNIKHQKTIKNYKKIKDMIFKLGKLAFEQLVKGNVIFCDEDLRECGIDVAKASVYSGLCTQIFREEFGLCERKVYSFVHLSIQEHLAALYVHLAFINKNINVLDQIRNSTWMRRDQLTLTYLHQRAVDAALESKNGHLDLFLRFLLGLSVESNQNLLHHLQTGHISYKKEETVVYIQMRIWSDPSPEKSINLFHCLNELGDHSLIEEIQQYLKSGRVRKVILSPSQWSALVFVLLTSNQNMNVYKLKEFMTLLPTAQPFLHKNLSAGIRSDHSVYQKRSDPEPSCVSMKSDASMVQPLYFNSGESQPDLKSIHLSGPIITEPDKLESLPQEFMTLLPFLYKNLSAGIRSDHSVYQKRSDPEPSCVSMQSDASMVQLLYFNSGDNQPDLKSIHLSGAIITEPDKPESLPQDFSDKIDPGFSHESEVLNTFRSNLSKRCQCLYEGTSKQRNPTSLNEIYTELYIIERESGEISNEHEVRQIETQSRRTTTEKTPIKCNDIFKPLPEKHKHIRSVLTKGVAGIGKTVSVQKFILDWTEEKENQDVHLIFPLPFREINLMKDKTLSLLDLLHLFFPETKEMQIFSDEYKVLFIFDGLDECRLSLDFHSSVRLCDVRKSTSVDVMLTNLIKGNLFPSALIWITSRPAAADLIPSECVDRVTEIRGFSDPQKEEYFWKRIRHKSLAYKIISHLKSSRSLYIMCHIPVFCWISVTVLERILREAKSQEIPKTLTQMYTHFLIIQTNMKHQKTIKNYKKIKDMIFKLGKLAFEQLMKGNVIFYDEDLRECGIDVAKASVYSGLCTQIFREEFGLCQGKVYSFVHLTIQEHLAALYVHLFFINDSINVFDEISKPNWMRRDQLTLTYLHQRAVDAALESKNGHLDLFLRFLLGLSVEYNQNLLHHLQTGSFSYKKEETVVYIQMRIWSDSSLEKSINLFHCLFELGDLSHIEEIQQYLKSGEIRKVNLSSSQWSALVFVLLTSEQNMNEFNLKEFITLKPTADEVLQKLLPVVKECRSVELSDCYITDKGCVALSLALKSNPSHLTQLNLSDNNIGDSGVKLISDVLENPHCYLEKLKLERCNITDEGCVALTSALRSNPSHLRLLNLTNNNNLGDSGVKLISDVLKNPDCKLEKLELSDCNITAEGCAALSSALRSNPSHLRELDLTENQLRDSGVKLLSAVLKNPDCKLEKLELRLCNITDKGCVALSSALRSNPSHLRHLNLSYNNLGDLGIKFISYVLENPHCKLKILRLSDCNITEEGCVALTSNPSHLRGLYRTSALRSKLFPLGELDLSYNNLGDSGVKLISDALKMFYCKLEILKLSSCNITDEGCVALSSALRSNPSHLRELNLSYNKIGDLGIKLLNDNQHYELKTVELSSCNITDEGCVALSSALRSNPSHLRHLNLSYNKIGDSGINLLNDNQHYELKTVDCGDRIVQIHFSRSIMDQTQTSTDGDFSSGCRSSSCNITDEGCDALTSALTSNPSHLIEIILTENKIGDSGVKLISDVLKNPDCKLKILKLSYCNITDEGCDALTSALTSNPSYLTKLILTGNKIGDSGVKLISDVLKNPDCKLKILELCECNITDEGCDALTSALTSNPSHLRDLSLSHNNLGDSGVKLISDVLKNSQCKLEILDMRTCDITAEGCVALSSALRSNPSHLRDLDLTFNEFGDSGVKLISDVLKNPDCKLEKLKLLGCKITAEGCVALSSGLRSNPSHLRELDLSYNDVRDLGVKLICDVLKNPDCKLEILDLSECNVTTGGCAALSSALTSNPSHLRDLKLSWNNLRDTDAKLISDALKNPDCKLEILDMRMCDITAEGCVALSSALRSNPSHLRNLDLSQNEFGDSGVKLISDVLKNPDCKLEKLKLWKCNITAEGCAALSSAVRSNPSHLRELNLSFNSVVNSGVKLISDLLKNPDSKLEILELCECNVTTEGCAALSSALTSNPSHLRDLKLNFNFLRDSGVKPISDVLENPDCKLEILELRDCIITDEGCAALSSALRSNPSHLRHLNLSLNFIGDLGVKLISAILENPQCKLQKLWLSWCKITDEGCLSLTSVLKTNPLHLKDLHLCSNNIGDSGVKQISDVLKNPDCKLEILWMYCTSVYLGEFDTKLRGCNITDEGCVALTSALRSNPSHLRELNLKGNYLGDSGVKLLSELKDDPEYKLKTLQ